MAPEVSEEEGSYASRFYRWFSESSKSCLLFLVAPPGLIDTLAQLLAWRSLLWLSMTWRRRYLTQNHFLSTKSLAWSLALHYFVQSGEALMVEGNKHTHSSKNTPSMKPTLAGRRGLYKYEVTTSTSTKRARRSNATTFKLIYLRAGLLHWIRSKDLIQSGRI